MSLQPGSPGLIWFTVPKRERGEALGDDPDPTHSRICGRCDAPGRGRVRGEPGHAPAGARCRACSQHDDAGARGPRGSARRQPGDLVPRRGHAAVPDLARGRGSGRAGRGPGRADPGPADRDRCDRAMREGARDRAARRAPSHGRDRRAGPGAAPAARACGGGAPRPGGQVPCRAARSPEECLSRRHDQSAQARARRGARAAGHARPESRLDLPRRSHLLLDHLRPGGLHRRADRSLAGAADAPAGRRGRGVCGRPLGYPRALGRAR